MTLVAAVEAVSAIVGGVSGIRGCPEYPTDAASAFPYAVVYANGGVIQGGPVGSKKGLHNIVIDLHVAHKDTPRDMEKLLPFVESITSALMTNPTLNGKCDTISNIEYSFQAFNYGGVNTIGYRFILQNVKIITAN